MNAIEIKPNTAIQINGNDGYIKYCDSTSVLIAQCNGSNIVISPDELREGFIDKSIKFVAKKTSNVLTIFETSDEAKKLEFYKYVVEEVDALTQTTNRKQHEKILNKAAEKFGWPDGKPISTSTSIRLYNKWKVTRKISALSKKVREVNKNKHDKISYRLMWQVIDEVYLQPTKPTITSAYHAYVSEFKRLEQEALIELREKGDLSKEPLGKHLKKSAFHNYVNELDPYEVTKAREGLKAARKKFRSRSGKIVTYRPLDRVECDAMHPQIGIKCIDEKTGEEVVRKPIIYIAFDAHTRVVVGYHICLSDKASEKSSAVIELLKHMVSPFKTNKGCKYNWPLSGAPDFIVLDNGSAFKSQWVKTMIGSMGADFDYCKSASAWEKGFVERFNRTIKDQFCRNTPGYVGNRKRGEEPVGTISEYAVVTKEEFIADFERYILDTYHQNPHRGIDGFTPYEFYEQCKHSAPPIDFELDHELSFIKGTEHYRKLRPEGIEFEKLQYTSPELENYYDLIRNTKLEKQKTTFLASSESMESIAVINKITGELIEAFCKDSRITEGTTLAEVKLLKSKKGKRDINVHCSSVSHLEAEKRRAKNKSTSFKKGNSSHDIEIEMSEEERENMFSNGNGVVANNHSGRTFSNERKGRSPKKTSFEIKEQPDY